MQTILRFDSTMRWCGADHTMPKQQARLTTTSSQAIHHMIVRVKESSHKMEVEPCHAMPRANSILECSSTTSPRRARAIHHRSPLHTRAHMHARTHRPRKHTRAYREAEKRGGIPRRGGRRACGGGRSEAQERGVRGGVTSRLY